MALNQLAHAFEAQEGAVALVHMPDRGVVAEGAHGAHAADAEDDFLADAHLAVAAVEAGAELAVLGGVAVDVGVHQVDGDAADLDAPDLGVDRAAGQVDVDEDRLALRVERLGDGHLGEVDLLVDGLLHAGGVDALDEVALRIEEADADKGQVEVRGGLAVVAAEDAEAARVDGQRLVRDRTRR